MAGPLGKHSLDLGQLGLRYTVGRQHLLDGMLKIKVSAPPEKGKANQCLLKFVARTLGVKKNAVSIIAGTTSPVKRVQVLGISAEMLLNKLNPKERSLP